ncbi:phosphatidylinositol-glycan biosynthesis class S protein [Pelomyxa schiedti]|nr:phosphatidylinositol-glycan biosynthesis class S protein [Pelomyxa schiedti]
MVPVWWATTTVHRAPLLYSDMLRAADWVGEGRGNVDVLVNMKGMASCAMPKELQLNVTGAPTVRVLCDDSKWLGSLDITNLELSELDVALQGQILLQGLRYEAGLYRIAVLFKNTSTQAPVIYVGKYRHTIILHSITGDSKAISAQIEPLLEPLIASTFVSEIGASKNHESGAKMAMQAAPQYHLSFKMLIEESSPDNQCVNFWNFSEITRLHFRTMLGMLHSAVNITIDSEVVRFASINKQVLRNEHSQWTVKEDDLPHLIDFGQWQQDVTSLVPTLNFVLLVPAPLHTPLQVLEKSGSLLSSNSYLIPQWGSVVIYNSGPLCGPNCTPPLTDAFSLPVKHWKYQLRQLLGIPFLLSESLNSVATPIYRTGGVGISQWEVDAIGRRVAREHLITAADSLAGLARLLHDLRYARVHDYIGTLVSSSLSSLKEANASLKKIPSDFEKVLSTSIQAVQDAHSAFFDQNMLALLYFPDEHKYAIYVPVFLPVCFQLAYATFNFFRALKMRNSQPKRL